MADAQGGRYFDPENLKRWESEKRLPVRHWHQSIAEAYGLSLDQVQRAVAESRRRRREAEKGGETVKRRRFFGTAAVIGMTSLPDMAQARDEIDRALDGTGTDLSHLDTAFQRHHGGYKGRTPAAVLEEMHTDLAVLGDVLSRSHPAQASTALTHTAAGLTGLVAIVQHDRGDQADASRWFATAEKAARKCGDRRMTAWVLARHAMVPLNYGAPQDAARLARQARAEAGKSATAAAALAAAVTARALAAAGDRDGATAALIDLRRITDRLDDAHRADTWTGYPLQKHHVHLSQAYTLLGDTRAAYAAQAAALALTRSASVMTRALLAIDTATCLQLDGEPAEAARTATTAWQQLPPEHRCGLVRSRIEALHRTLPHGPRGQLEEALHG
ncbi:transcriptional regulator [Streptomyces hoynatensis]|uniref:Transcriptional regulator n=2 Tax=Streptomyces hoynatensis TaxID=1141874 RepID=A0A3A9ZFR8_9ACTN|nr:transcriptional regulator [Streptomyces hoynatensis]